MTKRRPADRGRVRMSGEIAAAVAGENASKAQVLATARLAGIQAAKQAA